MDWTFVLLVVAAVSSFVALVGVIVLSGHGVVVSFWAIDFERRLRKVEEDQERKPWPSRPPRRAS